jgi:hypothetical protein
MIKPDVPVMLLDPMLDGMPNLSDVDLTTFTGDSVNTRCFEAEVILDGLKETDYLSKWEVYHFCYVRTSWNSPMLLTQKGWARG